MPVLDQVVIGLGRFLCLIGLSGVSAERFAEKCRLSANGFRELTVQLVGFS
jgi:hypothetical protein